MKNLLLWVFILFCGMELEHNLNLIPDTEVDVESPNKFFYREGDW